MALPTHSQLPFQTLPLLAMMMIFELYFGKLARNQQPNLPVIKLVQVQASREESS